MSIPPGMVEIMPEVPLDPREDKIYRLCCVENPSVPYAERTDRNQPWILASEQEALRHLCIGVAGVGGMGGLIAERLVRLGVGEVRIADPEAFDISNLNRQYGALTRTIGRSKAFETARLLRGIATDYDLEVYPQGIEATVVDQFVSGCAIVVDEIEFWNVGSCIRLHQAARRHGIPILNALTVGFASYVHLFLPDSMPVEAMLGMELEEALSLEAQVLDGSIEQAARDRLMQRTIDCFIPGFPKYFRGPEAALRNQAVIDRLRLEGKAPIIATNPPVAGGITVDRVLLYCLERMQPAVERSVAPLPATPGYVMFDAATLELERIETRTMPPVSP